MFLNMKEDFWIALRRVATTKKGSLVHLTNEPVQLPGQDLKKPLKLRENGTFRNLLFRLLFQMAQTPHEMQH